MANRGAFWRTTPGIATAVAAGMCALAVPYLVLHFAQSPSGLSTQPASPVLGPTETNVRRLVDTFAPLVYIASDERYLMDDPEYVLDNGVTLWWGEVHNEGHYGSFEVTNEQSTATSSKTLVDDVRKVVTSIKSYQSPRQYKYWLHIDDRLKGGDLTRAKALVRLLPVSTGDTEIQFWYFYPFNGPHLAKVCRSGNDCRSESLEQCGRHYGDWEHVSLLVSNESNELRAVYTERRDARERFTRSSDDPVFRSTSDSRTELKFKESHPVIYSAVFSHAHYAAVGNRNYQRPFSRTYNLGFVHAGTASIDLFDRTAQGTAFTTDSSYRIVSSGLPDFRVIEPAWLDFDGRWGQYEKLTDTVVWSTSLGERLRWPCAEVGMGPHGPKATPSWAGDFRRPATTSGIGP